MAQDITSLIDLSELVDDGLHEADAMDVKIPLLDMIDVVNDALNGAQAHDAALFAEIATPANPAANEHKIYFKSDGKMYRLNDAGTEVEVGAGAYTVCNGRLTLTTGTPILTSDVSGATTLYFTPFRGNQIGLYDGSNWVIHIFTQRSLSLAGLTASTLYDIFIYDNAGTLTLEAVAWTSSGAGTSTRATALTKQDEIYVKTGALTRRYLGTIYINSTGGQTDFSAQKRYVWNYYNRVQKWSTFTANTFHTYALNTWRSWNADNAHRTEYVVGVQEVTAFFTLGGALISNGTNYVYLGVGINATNSSSASLFTTLAAYLLLAKQHAYMPAVGYNYAQITEISPSANTASHLEASLDLTLEC